MTVSIVAGLDARGVLVDSVRRRSGAFRRLAVWSLVEAVPALLSGLLVARAVNDFAASDLRAGFGWLAIFLCSVVIGAWGARQSLGLLASVVEPFRDDLVTGVVTGAMRRSTLPGASPHTSDVARLSEQVEIVREAYAAVLMVVQEFTVVALAACLGLLALSPAALVFVGPPLLVALGVFLVALRLMAGWQRAAIVADERFAEDATMVSSGLRDVVACGGEDQVASIAGTHVEAHAEATRALGRLAAVGTLAIAIGSWLPLILLLGFGSWLVSGGASAGVLIGAATYILQGLQPALQTLVHGLSGPGLWLMVTLRRVTGAMDATVPDHPEAESAVLVAPDAALLVDAVTFAYSEWSAPVVAGLDLEVPAGDHLVVVGPSGVGKSTLAGLLSGLLTPQLGSVRMGDADVTDLPPEVLARHRVLIPQEAYVFSGTLRDNMTYLRSDVSPAELDLAVDVLGVAALVQRLGGYDAPLDQSALSSGERQLVTLVRAYLSPARLVVLDEAACYLDPAAEARVEQVFAARPGSLIVVAHRMSSALRARRVLVMDGTSVDVGTHEHLLGTSALYRDLVGHWQGA